MAEWERELRKGRTNVTVKRCESIEDWERQVEECERQREEWEREEMKTLGGREASLAGSHGTSSHINRSGVDFD